MASIIYTAKRMTIKEAKMIYGVIEQLALTVIRPRPKASKAFY